MSTMRVHRHAEGGGRLGCFTHEDATAKFRLDGKRDLKNQTSINLSLENAADKVNEVKRKTEAMRQYFHATFELFERVFEPMKNDEAYVVQPIHKLRHPMIFYLGHTCTFYVNKLALGGMMKRINPKFEEQFAIGVDEMSWDDLNTDHYDWPPVDEVWQYRALVREKIDQMFNQFELQLPLTFDQATTDNDHSFFWTIMMGIEHERIHIETASVHIRELPMEYISKSAFWVPSVEVGGKPPEENPLIEFSGDSAVKVGRQNNDAAWGWDCDYSDGVVHNIAAFKASEHLVCNAEYLKFVADGGYTTERYWDAEGWKWVSWKKPQHPWFWRKGDAEGEWKLRVQTEFIALPLDWPTEVNNLEARAYVQWLSEKKGKKLRLPTEGEWLHMYDVCIAKANNGVDNHFTKKIAANVNFAEGTASSCSVTKYKQGPLYDVVGNTWQHTETPVYPYKGFRVHPYYDDFSMPTFDGCHRQMKGGAWVSTGNEATRDARFAFRRHFYQFIGIRFIEGEDKDETAVMKNILGMDPPVDLASQRAFENPPSSVDISPKAPFGKVVADLAKDAYNSHATQLPKKRALDLFCGGGRCSFELTSDFEEVIGVDFSARTLQAPFAMRERGMATYSVITDAETGAREGVEVQGKDFTFGGEQREKACFYQSDPANLHAHLTNFNLIVAFNLLEASTSYDAAAIPSHILGRLNVGGVFFMCEPKERSNSGALSNQAVVDQLAAAGCTVATPLSEITLYMADTKDTGRIVAFEFAVLVKQ